MFLYGISGSSIDATVYLWDGTCDWAVFAHEMGVMIP